MLRNEYAKMHHLRVGVIAALLLLGVVGLGKDLRTALDRAYGRIEHIDFEGMQYRTDIGAKAFK